jgi:hypothetical protein
VAVVVLWGLDVSVARLLWSLLLAVVLLAVVQVLVGTGRAALGAPAAPASPAAPVGAPVAASSATPPAASAG